MTAKPKADIVPRIWTEAVTAGRLGMSVTTFRNKLGKLRLAGFPARDELLRGYDSQAVETWLDNRAGLKPLPASSTTPAGPSLGDIPW